MAAVRTDYINNLPPIYQDVLKTFRMFNPKQHDGEGVAFQTLHSGLYDKYTLAEIRVACERMSEKGVVTIRNGIFAYPTELGVELIDLLSAEDAPEANVPEFPSVPETTSDRTGGI